MKTILTSFARYEYWANQRLLDLIWNMDAEQREHEIISSFPSIHKTCLHIWDASSIWWQRLHLVSDIVVPSLSFHPSITDINNGLLAQNEQWINWVKNTTDAELEKELPYRNMKGDAFIQPVKEIILHLSNHGTYHRGQLVTMLRQVGVEKVPATDYILFARS